MALGDKIKEDIERKMAGLHFLAENIGSHMEKQAQSNATWTDRTGDTRRAIHGGADRKKNGATIYLAHGSKVGLFLEEGTAPHVIRAKNKKTLRFTAGGGTVFAKEVHHPGIKAQPIIGPTVDANRHDIVKQVKRYWEG